MIITDTADLYLDLLTDLIHDSGHNRILKIVWICRSSIGFKCNHNS